MGKVIAAIFAGIIGFLVMASVGSVSGGGFDYATADEERQQKYLDNVAKGFRAGFKFSAGKSAEITQTFSDASLDMLSFSIQYKDTSIDKVSSDQIEKQRQWMTKQSCKMAVKQKLLDNGITLRLRLYRPSGSQMGTVQVDPVSCAKYSA